MRGTLHLNNIAACCILGLNANERVHTQRLRIDVEIQVDFLQSLRQQDTSGTVDWSTLPRELAAILEHEKFYLAETACVALARRVLSHSNAAWTRIRLTKLEADTGAESVAAEFEAHANELISANM
jgi:FolB domain-containing protein